MIKTYRYRVADAEHPGDYEPFADAIRGAGANITTIDWTEDDDEAIIHFTADDTSQIQAIKAAIQQLL